MSLGSCFAKRSTLAAVLAMTLASIATAVPRQTGPAPERPEAAPPPVPAVLAPVAPAVDPRPLLEPHRQAAIDLVVAASRSEDPFLRANAAESAQYLPDRATPMLQLALEDPHQAVRFAALAVIGRQKLAALAPMAQARLEDESLSVRVAAMFALRRCGVSVDITPMAQLLTSDDQTVRGNAVMLLGQMGDPSAIPMLKQLSARRMARANAARDTIVRLQFAEAIVRLGDDTYISAIRAGAYSVVGEVRVLATRLMGDLGDQKMQAALAQMLGEPPIEQQLAAAESLAKLGNEQGLPVVLANAVYPAATIRAQAAMTLGQFHAEPAVTTLVQLMQDPEPQVRLSAAASILRLLAAGPRSN
ncbi:MAG: HEAT repeat domain-containing protein [Phycisphaeraceae bacterium]|nr:HEAT repeat domain-containing protein [Phycisphaeraceae bacterium]